MAALHHVAIPAYSVFIHSCGLEADDLSYGAQFIAGKNLHFNQNDLLQFFILNINHRKKDIKRLRGNFIFAEISDSI